jgi:hypothetical protein
MYKCRHSKEVNPNKVFQTTFPKLFCGFLGTHPILRFRVNFKMSKIAELESRIRDVFNIPRRHKNARADRANFNQACSALDTIGDTELALQEFKLNNSSFTTGMSYILAYGVLQAIFLQQDAIKHLALSLGVPFHLPVELKEIRELRNDATGHPTKRDIDKKNNIYSFHGISRATLSKAGFQMMSSYSDDDSHVFINVQYDKIINIQSKFSEKLLDDILNKLINDENTHREKFMNDKLTDCLHASLPYIFSKVKEGARSTTGREFALSNFKCIIDAISSFEKKLIDRGEEESIKYLKNDLSYPAKKVFDYLEGKEGVDLRAAEIYIDYIERQVDALKKIAKEIDENYQKEI